MNIKTAIVIFKTHVEDLDEAWSDLIDVDYKQQVFRREQHADLTFAKEQDLQERNETLSYQRQDSDNVAQAIQTVINASEHTLYRHGLIDKPVEKPINKVDKLPKHRTPSIRF